MRDPQLQEIIDGLRNRLQAELEAQLGAVTAMHDEALERARRAAIDETEQRWGERLEAERREWSARLEAEVSAAKAEAEQRLDAGLSAARADADQRLEAESTRIRLEAEQAAAESAAVLRRDLEAAAEERAASVRRDLEAAAEERAALLRTEFERAAEDRAGVLRRELEAAAEERAAAVRSELEAAALVRAEAVRREAEAAAEDRAAAIRREAEEAAASRAGAIRQELEQAIAAERQRSEAQIAAARERADREVADARAELAAERERVTALAARASTGAAASNGSRVLEAIGALDAAQSLSDVLALTAAAAALEAPRAAIFVASGPQLEEWQVPEVPPLSRSPVRTDTEGAGLLGQAMAQGELRVSGPAGPLAPAFAALPPHRTAIAVPLMLDGQPVGIVYADEGADGSAPASWRDAIQILARHASARLAFLTAVRTAQAVRLMTSGGFRAGAAAPAQDDEQAARRYARLLVSEIKLYNEQAVRVGRERRDLAHRLRPEIDRARRLYDERVPSSVPGRDACFHQELVQTLADGDAALLG